MSSASICGCAPIRARPPSPISVGAAQTYYETWGRTGSAPPSSRRARSPAIAPLGAAFIEGLRPFIWRKYFDFAAIADIHAMKRQIQTVKGHDEIAVAGHDIKLGRGGIREIEFFVQTQQLVFGGRAADPAGLANA